MPGSTPARFLHTSNTSTSCSNGYFNLSRTGEETHLNGAQVKQKSILNYFVGSFGSRKLLSISFPNVLPSKENRVKRDSS
jgi:hypothetical protein